MSLSTLMAARVAQDRPVRVGVIGTGAFATQFLAQARHLPALHVAAIADHDPQRAHTALALASWPPARAVARDLGQALSTGGTLVTDDCTRLTETPGLEVMVVATAAPIAAVTQAAAALDAGIHVVMACGAADALVGPALAARAGKAGLIYSLAQGDQPALICELVDWARSIGLEIAAAGRGVRWRPGFERISPDTVWSHLGLDADSARARGLDGARATASLDGTRAALDLAQVANATGLSAPSRGLRFPPCGSHDLAHVFHPTWDGGRLSDMGVVEAASSLEVDGRTVIGDLRHGVFVTFTSPSPHASQAFAELGLPIDGSGCYGARWRPHRLAGLELALSPLSVALRGEATGCPQGWHADVAATAKRDLAKGEILDGIGGTSLTGTLMPGATLAGARLLSIALAEGATLRRPVPAGQMLTEDDLILADGLEMVLALRREMATSGGIV